MRLAEKENLQNSGWQSFYFRVDYMISISFAYICLLFTCITVN